MMKKIQIFLGYLILFSMIQGINVYASDTTISWLWIILIVIGAYLMTEVSLFFDNRSRTNN